MVICKHRIEVSEKFNKKTTYGQADKAINGNLTF